jgi:23S rRNA pseudouridine2605 synthase
MAHQQMSRGCRTPNSMASERLQKILSASGISSRRRAEDLIRAGKVTVNGTTAGIGDKADLDVDVVKVEGKVVKPADTLLYVMLNKPREYICTRKDPRGRRSVYDLLPKDIRTKVWNVGRLDFYSEGLLLFTNDGDVTQQLMHPSFGHEKEYKVELNVPADEVDFSKLEKLRMGLKRGDIEYQPAEVKRKGGFFYITVKEGRKHQVRRMIETVGYKVASLKRVRMNRLELGDLPVGKIEMVERGDIM